MKKIIFFNTAWMDRYQGATIKDKMQGGGKHIEEHGWGGEMFNFKPINGKLYGYVQVGGNINLNRLGAKALEDSIENVTVVWTAKNPFSSGNYIIGWYKNATLHRSLQKPPNRKDRKWKTYQMDFFASASQSNTKLLLKDERTVPVPRGDGGMGQRNIWYGDNNPTFVKKVLEYIETGKFKNNKNKSRGSARQTDPLKRIAVEKKAVQVVTKYYEKLGYEVDSVEKDNVGWDLKATNGKIVLKVEVKGLSGKEIATELTPNEYYHLKADRGNYRICTVTEALSAPNLKVFSYSVDNGEWTSEDSTELKITEIIGARIN